MNIERALIERIGDVGRKLHTGRSRNDQVATDSACALRDDIDALARGCATCSDALVAAPPPRHATPSMPGYTHLQRAQPVASRPPPARLLRDAPARSRPVRRLPRARVTSCRSAPPRWPARRFRSTARRRATSSASPRSPPTASTPSSDRDFVLEFAFGCRDLRHAPVAPGRGLVLWSTHGVRLRRAAGRLRTGSSIMPQKKNPDVPSWCAGKSGRRRSATCGAARR